MYNIVWVMEMFNFMISILVGLIPDVIFYTFNIVDIKNIKKHKILLFILVFITYLLTNMLFRYNLYLYLSFDILLYLIIKKLYHSKISDFFLIFSLDIYLLITSILCYVLIPNYVIALIINKIMLLSTLLISHKLRYPYSLYLEMWDRKKKKMPIKSITLRNISLTALNIGIISFYLVLLYLTSLI